MNNTIFSNSFNFNTIRFEKYHYTDNRMGCKYHYIAKLEKGRAKIVSDGGTLELSSGDYFYIPLELSYRSYWYGEPDIVFLSLGFTFFPNSDGKSYPLQKLKVSKESRDIFDKIKTEQDHSCLNIGVFYEFLGGMLKGMEEIKTNKHQSTLTNAMAFMSRNPEADASKIARHCNISQSGLYYVFGKYAGITPNQYKLSLKVKKAETLLTTTDMSIEEISNRCGFCSSAYFRKVFKSITGKLPSKTRNEKMV